MKVSKTSIFKATSVNKDLKRYIFKKVPNTNSYTTQSFYSNCYLSTFIFFFVYIVQCKNEFITLPRKGWSISQVQKRFEQESKNSEL